MADNEKLSVGGFLFYTERDAQLAAVELKKMEYLEARIDYSRPESVLLVYVKTIHERIFQTPVGFRYLNGLRDFLLKQPEIKPEDVPEIPLFITFSTETGKQNMPEKNRLEAVGGMGTDGKREKTRFLFSVILNVLLVMAVAAMFSIALRSNNPNILNYERAITNRYAAWEQELTEREQKIREKEKELRMEQ